MNVEAVPNQDHRARSFRILGVPVRQLLALRFSPHDIEEKFIRYYLPISLFQSRVALCLAVILLIGDYVADSLFYGRSVAPGNVLRVTLLTPALLAYIILSYVELVKYRYELWISLFYSGMSLLLFYILYLIDLAGGNGLSNIVGFLNLVFIMIFGFVLIGTRFYYSIFSSTVATVFYVVLLSKILGPGPDFYYDLYQIFTVSVLCIILGYTREIVLRAGFAVQTELALKNSELDRLNADLQQSQADMKVKTAALVTVKEDLRRRADRENLNKSKFLADAAHDLRQPMQALSNYLEAADGAAQRSDVRKCAELIGMSQTALRLARSSFRAVLEISQLESGFIRAEYSNFDVQELLDEVLSQVQGAAEERSVRVRVRRRASSSPLIVRSDRHLLGRVLMNLVSNAIKYKDEGKGDAAAVLIGAVGFPNRVRLDVFDNGPGIPREQWGNIFKPFTQVNNPERDREKGVGLGLSIVNAILPLLDAHRLDMNSVEGKGTRFSLEVPRTSDPPAWTAEATGRSAASLQLAGLYVLYVEDDALVRNSTTSLFEAHGVLYEDVASVRKLEERLPTLERMPDVIVTDYRLPDGAYGRGRPQVGLERVRDPATRDRAHRGGLDLRTRDLDAFRGADTPQADRAGDPTGGDQLALSSRESPPGGLGILIPRREISTSSSVRRATLNVRKSLGM